MSERRKAFLFTLMVLTVASFFIGTQIGNKIIEEGNYRSVYWQLKKYEKNFKFEYEFNEDVVRNNKSVIMAIAWIPLKKQRVEVIEELNKRGIGIVKRNYSTLSKMANNTNDNERVLDAWDMVYRMPDYKEKVITQTPMKKKINLKLGWIVRAFDIIRYSNIWVTLTSIAVFFILRRITNSGRSTGSIATTIMCLIYSIIWYVLITSIFVY